MERKNIMACWVFATLVLALFLAAGCGEPAVSTINVAHQRSEEEIKADYEATFAALNAEEDKEKQFQFAIEFLERNPDTIYSLRAIDYVANDYYVGHKDDPTAAVAFVEVRRQRLTAERMDGARDLLIQLYSEVGNADGLRKISAELEDEGKLNFMTHLQFANAAASADAWDLTAEHAQAAFDGITPENVRAVHPNPNVSNEAVAGAIRAFKGRALASLGEAQVKKGDFDAGLKSYKAMEKFIAVNYIGVPAEPYVNLNWAKALIAKGEYEAAMRRIAPDAVMQGDESAIDAFREAYDKSGGDEAGFEQAVEAMRAELARPVEEFEAYTYEGNKVAWSELKGRVTLLAFWFPT